MIAALVLLAACDAAGAREVATGIVAADNAADIERVLGYYAPEAVLQPPEEPEIKLPEIRPRYERLFATFRPKIELSITSVNVQGEIAILQGHNGGKLEAKDGGPAKKLDDDFVMVMRCDSGRWRISHLMWQPAPKP